MEDTEGLLANLGLGFLEFLEGIHVHPAFENLHAVHGMSAVDQFLDDVREGGLDEAACFVEAFEGAELGDARHGCA